MDKDPNKDLDQNKPEPKPTDDGDAKDTKSFNISADDWHKTQDTIKHLANTTHNLNAKLEAAHQHAQSKPVHSDSNDNPNDNSKFVSKEEFQKLVDKNEKLQQSVQHKNHHADVLQHAKDALKMNHMKVSPSTFNHLLGTDNQSTDANIGWFKKIYKQAKSKPRRFPPENHHSDKEPTVGKQLAKDDKSNGAMRNIDDCFKN